MFRWLFLNQNAPVGENNWKLGVLRIILLSALLLDCGIAIVQSMSAESTQETGNRIFLAGLIVTKLLALLICSAAPRRAAMLMLAGIYGGAAAILSSVADMQLAMLAFPYIYAAPLLARLFFGQASVLSLMFANTFAFLLLLTGMMPAWFGVPLTLSGYGQLVMASLIFLFFNLLMPLVVSRVLLAFEESFEQLQQSNRALNVSYTQYQEVFENAGTALLLTDAFGQILQANHQANLLLGRHPDAEDDLALFSWLSAENNHRRKNDQLDDSLTLPLSAYRTRDGRMVAMDNISRTSSDHWIVALRDVSNLQKMQTALQLSLEREDYLNSHDALTNLPNREMLRQYLQTVLTKQDPNNINVTALVSFRVNSIRHANQQFGAHTGDVMLRRFADELSLVLPKNCFCARLRSIVLSFVVDQFRTPGDIIDYVDQLRQVLPKELEVNGEILVVQFSAGIAVIRAEDSNPDELIRRSEVALDGARRASDQSVTLFDEGNAQQLRRTIDIDVGIANGLKQNEFALYYQPKVAHDGSVGGVEALLRWRSAAMGRISPAEFIPIAERSGLIHQLSNFVIEQACTQIRCWLDEFGTSPVVAVNLAVNDIARLDLLELIEASCARHHVEPRFLEFEITETGLIANEKLSIHHLNGLKNRGFGIAIDDFGTGYSSLSKLSHFPAHTVKIDRSFVAQIGYNRKSEMIIKAIVSLADILSCSTVAEGVENESQEAFLKDVGCEFFQGYYYYRPLDVAAMNTLLRDAYVSKQVLLQTS
ncbi:MULTISPECIES: putative bifunctional diguanylate cyclase/phosphodiesterase [unclassified Undibacterium]|uniref:putative bifunctional diguanylate cyclase/phosphodiesterase n=1 Tax=unclassified Undibacterium TaxID=2630295 RepID=UPI002AC98E8C|nr:MULTISPECIES: EAL domain-containing protein [unclassified Undibacterium]MEB0140281.1 EAL domain-containing protein [Undibacterium sp. CCC2.1]MEB0173305.1 EAL domain-containing protein [Undibacterium sp. CCC1.1]MEB0177124.1 EAL domain-containing protein [Undibacterium sp. CCC3.4]MEB0216420.1 EAL domain-containing protein [Undibacterium sp. 5I2]WPX45526.1 EAL domain-containing protein [Undibacterium sp. CCC3.4]